MYTIGRLVECNTLARQSSKVALSFYNCIFRSLPTKLDELVLFISDCPSLHIVASTEKWLASEIGDGEIDIDRFWVF